MPAAGLVITASVGLWAASKLGAAAPSPVRRPAAIERCLRERRGSALDTSYDLNDPVIGEQLGRHHGPRGLAARPWSWKPVAKGERLRNAQLTDRSVAKIVKAHAVRVGLDPAAFAGHSLRSGFLTSAAARGASIFKMADQSRHRSMDTLRGYVRDAEIFKDHAGAGLL